MLLTDVARTSREITAAPGRNEKVALLARLFREADPDEAPLVVSYLAGAPPQRRTGVGHRTLSALPQPAGAPGLTVPEVHGALDRIASVRGQGAQAERRRLLTELLAAATAEEQQFLYRLLTGELRQGALDALAVEGLAEAAGVPAAQVRRAVMFGGSLAAVARELLARGPDALADFRLRVGRPVRPMLAQSAKTVPEGLERLGPCAVEEKLDGIRVQAHLHGAHVALYTRTLDDITGRLPEITDAVRGFSADEAVLDGEVVVFDEAERLRPFQEVSQRVGSRLDVASARAALPARVRFFDVLSADGRDLTGRTVRERHRELARIVPAGLRVRRLVLEAPDAAEQRVAAEDFAATMLRDGREGVICRSLLNVRVDAVQEGGVWCQGGVCTGCRRGVSSMRRGCRLWTAGRTWRSARRVRVFARERQFYCRPTARQTGG